MRRLTVTGVPKYMAPTKKKVKLEHKKKQSAIQDLHGQRLTCHLTMFLVYIDRDWYTPTRTNRRLDILTKKRKQNPLPGDDASTAQAVPGRFVRNEQRKARQANTTPNGGPHLELGRLRLKTCS